MHCEINLRLYPFDKQNCSVKLSVINVEHKSTILLLKNITEHIRDSQSPLEFYIESASTKIENSAIIYIVILDRYVSFYLFSLYFPTVCIHLIGYGTLFIQPDDFQNRGSMSLTTLLVLISLYSDILNSLPATSYIKFVDIWFISSILFHSIIIIVHIITNDTRDLVYKFKANVKIQDMRQFNANALKISQYLLGTVYITFVVIYWSYLLI